MGEQQYSLQLWPLPLAHPNSPRRLFPLHSAEEVARLLEELRPAQESSLTRLPFSVVELVAPSCVVDLLLPLMKLSPLDIAVSEVMLHEEYDSWTITNDICLLKLSGSADF